MKFREHKKIILSAILLVIAMFFVFLLTNKVDQEKSGIVTSPPPVQSPSQDEVIKKYYPDTIPEMSEKTYSGSDLKLGEILKDDSAYTRYAITYISEGFTISGALNIPKGDGPFPILIFNHGYYDPKTYRSGEGLSREQDFFAKNGYVTLATDYRDHAQSDVDPRNEVRPRAGYVEDSINAVNAIQQSDITTLDKENIGMLGHSMGGGVTLNVMVTKPDTAKAYALLAPINSDYRVNFDTWVATEWPEITQKFYAIYGTYQENQDVWESLSAKNYFSRINAPIMLHQGVNDTQVPVEWSRELENLLKEAGKDITYYEYAGEEHVFIESQNLVMQRTLNFFDSILKMAQ